MKSENQEIDDGLIFMEEEHERSTIKEKMKYD